MAIKLSKNGKRLGRPPKDKNKTVVEQNTGGVFIIDTPIQKVQENKPIITDGEIECEFKKIKWAPAQTPDTLKEGVYDSYVSNRLMTEFGKNSWVVLAYLKADFEKHREESSNEEIIVKCVNYLNKIEVGRGSKKTNKYGNLKLFRPENIKFTKKFGDEVAIVELVTDQRKNDNFWGEGERY